MNAIEQFLKFAALCTNVWWVFYVADKLREYRSRLEKLEKGDRDGRS